MLPYTYHEALSDPLIDGLLRFSTESCCASSGIFYWVDDHSTITSLLPFNVPPDLINCEYDPRKDPMHIENLIRRRMDIAFLSLVDEETDRDFSRFLNSYALGDEVDLVFKVDGRLIGGLALFRPIASRAFHTEAYAWESMRRHFETALRCHQQVRTKTADTKLCDVYSLTKRERQVLDLLANGASNGSISAAIGISLATTKTHVVNILDKLGVESRTAAVALALRLRLS